MGLQITLVSWLTGAATVNLINSSVDIFFKPLLNMFSSKGGNLENWQLGEYKIGLFILEIVKFLLLSLTVGIILLLFPIN